jgi:hypothetical protein
MKEKALILLIISFRCHARRQGRISIYDVNTDDIELSSSETQLKKHTVYDEEHLKQLKYLFQQITGPENNNLDAKHFESAARSICHSLTESSEANSPIDRRSVPNSSLYITYSR